MSYDNYELEDFAGDPRFREWVLQPDPQNILFWQEWMINNPGKEETIERARLLVRAYYFKELAYTLTDKQKLLGKINQAIEAKEKAEKSNVNVPAIIRFSYGRDKVPRTKVWFVKAAVFIMGLVASSIFIYEKTMNDAIESIETISNIKIYNPSGRQKIALPDGSMVVLHGKSKLYYPSAFASDIREVTLTGEAFFDIMKDANKPFIIRTDAISAQVLGTTFNIRSHAGSANALVCLVSGRIIVEKIPGKSKAEPVLLAPGEAVELDSGTGELVKRTFDYMKEVSWKDGTIYFDETPIEEVFEKLEKWYGVYFQYNEIPEKVKPISGSFTDEDLNNVLMSISYTVRFDYEIKGKNVIVKFN